MNLTFGQSHVTKIILGEASGLGANLFTILEADYWISGSSKSDVVFNGFRSEKCRYINRLYAFYKILRKANSRDSQLIFIMNSLRLFPHKFELLNICSLIVITIFWRGKIRYIVGGGTPLVLHNAKYGSPTIRDFQVQLLKDKYTVIGLYLLVLAERILIQRCDEIFCIANFYKEIYVLQGDVKVINLPLSKEFLGKDATLSYDEWWLMNKTKCKRKIHAKISYVYRTDRKGSNLILESLDNLNLENCTVSIYHDISFEALLDVFANSDIIIDNTSAEGLGYLGLLALFNGCLVISSFDERYWNYGPFVTNICCNRHSAKSESVKIIRSQIKTCIDIRDSLVSKYSAADEKVFRGILKAHFEST